MLTHRRRHGLLDIGYVFPCIVGSCSLTDGDMTVIDLPGFTDASQSIAVLHERCVNLGRYIDNCISFSRTICMLANLLISLHLYVRSIFETYELGLYYKS